MFNRSDAEGGAILELRGSAAAVDHLAQWHARYRPERVSVLNRQATDWYVFAEELWTVRPDGGDIGWRFWTYGDVHG